MKELLTVWNLKLLLQLITSYVATEYIFGIYAHLDTCKLMYLRYDVYFCCAKSVVSKLGKTSDLWHVCDQDDFYFTSVQTVHHNNY